MSLLSSRLTRLPTSVSRRTAVTTGLRGRLAGQTVRLASTVPSASGPSPLVRGLLGGVGVSLAFGLVAYGLGVVHLGGSSSEGTAITTRYGSHEDVKKAIDELRAAFPDEKAVSTDPEVVKTYGSSPNSYHPASPHSVVVHVHSTEDVVKIVNIARKYRVPVVAYSGATSLEGHFSGVCDPLEPNVLRLTRTIMIRSMRQAVFALTCQAWTRF